MQQAAGTADNSRWSALTTLVPTDAVAVDNCSHKHSTDETTRLYEAGWFSRGIMPWETLKINVKHQN